MKYIEVISVVFYNNEKIMTDHYVFGIKDFYTFKQNLQDAELFSVIQKCLAYSI